MPGVATIHTLYAVEVGTSNVLGGITAQNLPTATEIRNEGSSGEVYNRFQSLVAQRPGASFTTQHISAALALIGISAQSIAGLTGDFHMYAQKATEAGTREGTLSHRKYSYKEGLIVPRTLTVSHGGDAELSYDVIATYDGTNDPVVITDSQTLVAGIADAERFSIGPVTIGSKSLGQVRQIEIDFGLDVVTEGSDGEIWDRYAWIKTISPQVTLRGVDIEWLKSSNIPLAGLNSIHANTTIYLRKRAAGGGFVVDGTAEHVKFTFAGLAYVDSAMDASGSDPAEVSVIIPCIYDGTNAPITFGTSAIT